MHLQDGRELRADLLIQGLGYDKPHAYLSPPLYRSLNIGEDGLHLYRNILAPHEPVCRHLFADCGQSINASSRLYSLPFSSRLARSLEVIGIQFVNEFSSCVLIRSCQKHHDDNMLSRNQCYYMTQQAEMEQSAGCCTTEF